MEVASVFASPSFSASSYASYRPRYPSVLLSYILSHLPPTSSRSLVVDLGCGPGTFTNDLAPHFGKVVGIDPSEVMLEEAERDPDKKGNVEYRKGTAEDMKGVEDGTVDLITSGTASHWFPAPEWWEEAARVLKKGGVVACFLSKDPQLPPSRPHFPFFASLALRLRASLAPYAAHGNKITASLYDLLPMPDVALGWSEPERKKWLVSEGEGVMDSKMTLGGLKMRLGTLGPVNNWRNSHPDIPHESKEDIIQSFIEEIKQETGWTEHTEVEFGSNLAVVIVKRL